MTNRNSPQKHGKDGLVKCQDFSKMFPKRKDGRYQTNYKDSMGKWHTLTSTDPETLYYRLQDLKEHPKVYTFLDLSREWMEQKETQIGWKTAEAYTAPLARLQERFGDAEPQDIAPAEINAYLALLGKQGYARRTVQMYRDIMHMIYDYALALGRVSASPLLAVQMPKGLHTTHREPPSETDIQAIIAHPDAPLWDFAMVGIMTGLRRGELLGLRAEDVDRDRMVLRVSRSVEFVGNDPQIKMPKTAAGVRSVFLPDRVLPLFPVSKGYLWHMAGDEEKPLTKQAFRKRWEGFRKVTGTTVSPHQFRHLYTTYLYEAGVPLLTAQHQLGHANASTTLSVYTHLRESKEQEGMQGLNRILDAEHLPK